MFLMALCVDYNIFLASRAAREETVGGSTYRGVLPGGEPRDRGGRGCGRKVDPK